MNLPDERLGANLSTDCIGKSWRSRDQVFASQHNKCRLGTRLPNAVINRRFVAKLQERTLHQSQRSELANKASTTRQCILCVGRLTTFSYSTAAKRSRSTPPYPVD